MALRRIVLRDFVIVRELDLDLSEGFSALTGETGAGKSILIDALQLVTGARADVGAIREGAARTEVCAEFDVSPTVRATLDDDGFACEELLLLRRTVDTAGKSRAWINGSPATAQQLRNVGEQLLDIYGQHAWQSLTRADTVRGLLDSYAKVDSTSLQPLWQAWRSAIAQLERAKGAQTHLQSERERLAWQIAELEKLHPQPHEWEDLSTQHGRLANGQSLLNAAQAALQALDGEATNAVNHVHTALGALQDQLTIEPHFQGPADVLASSLAQLEDAVRTLRSYTRHTELDPDKLAELDTRMGLWMSMARRYKRAPAELPELLVSWQQEMVQLDAASDLEVLQSHVDARFAAYRTQATQLSKARTKAAPKLAQAISQAMQGLGMDGGVFQVKLEASASPMQSGLEEVHFLVAGHAGASPRAVAKVASGGELSRIALAIAVTTSQLGTAATLIFDEVDAGIGGAVAQTVGRLMQQLGADRQVLAVTHLPQVAACAHHHLLVSKLAQADGVSSTVGPLQAQGRVQEIARMLGGSHLTSTTTAHAAELLASCQ